MAALTVLIGLWVFRYSRLRQVRLLGYSHRPFDFDVLCYEYTASLKATAVLGTFLRQLLEKQMLSAADEESLLQNLQDKVNLPTPSGLFSALSQHFKHGESYFLILDGLDELPRSEQADIAAILEAALKDTPH